MSVSQSLKKGINIATTGVLLITELMATGAINLGEKYSMIYYHQVLHYKYAPLSR